MKHIIMFIGWKIAELLIYVLSYPFFFIGAWGIDFSDWCHDRALRHHPRVELR